MENTLEMTVKSHVNDSEEARHNISESVNNIIGESTRAASSRRSSLQRALNVDPTSRRSSQQHVLTSIELGKYHLGKLDSPELVLNRHLYKLLLEFSTRYAFTIFAQVMYDYVTLSLYSRDATQSFTTRYINAYSRAYALRSQTRCYLQPKSFIDTLPKLLTGAGIPGTNKHSK